MSVFIFRLGGFTVENIRYVHRFNARFNVVIRNGLYKKKDALFIDRENNRGETTPIVSLPFNEKAFPGYFSIREGRVFVNEVHELLTEACEKLFHPNDAEVLFSLLAKITLREADWLRFENELDEFTTTLLTVKKEKAYAPSF